MNGKKWPQYYLKLGMQKRFQLLLDQGIPVEALLFDDQSDSTFQEAINTATLLLTPMGLLPVYSDH